MKTRFIPGGVGMQGFRSRHAKTLFETVLFLAALAGSGLVCSGADFSPRNLALSALGGRARSWEPGVETIPEHEPAKANDGSLHSYWVVRAENLPADLGVEWPTQQKISSVVVRYFDGRMVRGPAVARTQQWARLQYWVDKDWKDLDPQVMGRETSVVRYVFEPVTTTRVRLLFTEPPDPEARRFPDRLGIYVCEFEAYRDVPFQWVNSPDRVVPIPGQTPQQGDEARSYLRHFNEPPSGDAGYDTAGPLIVEPKQTRIFTDTLAPTLIVSESAWARQACAVRPSGSHALEISNGFLQLEISTAAGFAESRLMNRVTGESVFTPRSTAFIIRTSEGSLSARDFKVVRSDASGSDEQVSHLRVDLARDKLDVAVHYELRRQDHFYHKWLTLTNKSGLELQVRDVVVSSLELPRPIDLMAGQELTYPVTRLEKGGFFSCLETVYWDHQGDALVYYPGASLEPGQRFETEKAAVGVFKNRGEQWLGWDRGVRDWVIEYHDQISPLRDEWPDVYCEGWSAKIGVKELIERPEWSEHFMETAGKLGIRYMDAYEPMHQAMSMPAEWVGRFADLANRHHIATGFWIDFGSDADWGTGTPLRPLACKLSPEGENYFEKIVDFVRKFKLQAFHWADFFAVWSCSQTQHGHPPGKYSIYAQGQRMLRFGQELRQASPGVMLGADGGLTNPQFVRYEDSRAHGTFYGGYEGDHFPSVEPDIHLDRLYADMNRVYFHGSHAEFLRPWFRMLNVVNHYGQETHHHDRAGFRYSLLSGIAMAGQVTFNDAPDDVPESELEFSQRWLAWAKANRDYLKQGDKLFDRSVHFADVWQGDAESLSGFAHIRKDRGYIFLLNPSPVEQIAELTLALDAPPSQRFVVEEAYPGGMTLEGPQGGEYPEGGKLRATVPGKQVRILWIAPAAAGGGRAPLRSEDVRAAEARRYLGEWNLVERSPEAATLRSHFVFPAGGREYLASPVSEASWSRQPWAYDKAYLVLLLQDEREELHNNWIADNLRIPGTVNGSTQSRPLSVSVNGMAKALHAFKTGRNQMENLTRCYFVDLEGETKLGQPNEVDITLPIRTGLVFSGAYLDLPDQMPYGVL